ncbi:MAG: sirohydrochlorin chelatase [Leptospirillia bacterium]
MKTPPLSDASPIAIVVIGHGSPMEDGNLHFRETFRKLKACLPSDFVVREAFLEHAEPSVSQVLSELSETGATILLFPFLLFDAGHSKGDLWGFMKELREGRPDVRVAREWAIGTDWAPIEVLQEILPPKDPGIRDLVVVVGRGSLDPAANASLYYQGRRLWERRRGPEFRYAFIGVTEPRFLPFLDDLDISGYDRLLVVPYFLFEGVLMERIRKATAAFAERRFLPRGAVVTPPFGDHPILLSAIAKRLVRLAKNRHTVVPRWVPLDPPLLSTF